MTLHIFNPEHDIALAKDTPFFTAPHAARALRTDLGFMPMLWAEDGDMVLVDDVEAALEASRHLKRRAADVVFVTLDDLRLHPWEFFEQVRVQPWGWDKTLAHQLTSASTGFEACIPSSDSMAVIRKMSNRRFAAENVLPKVAAMDERFVGESHWCDTLELVKALVRRNGQSVLKAPWSSSGRGLRYVDDTLTGHVEGWCRNLISQQGGVMVEPYYNKVMDFGMEFHVGKDGTPDYRGLSLFRTENGAYTGSMLATEADKRKMLARYIPLTLLDKLKECLSQTLRPLVRGNYQGPLGIDLMVVAGKGLSGFALHPCVEVNLRRTMGHVALALSPAINEPWGLMHIDFDGHYRLRVSQTGENLLNTTLVR